MFAAIAVTSSESLESISASLKKELGEVFVWGAAPSVRSMTIEDENTPDPEFDRAAFDRLKMKLAAKV